MIKIVIYREGDFYEMLKKYLIKKLETNYNDFTICHTHHSFADDWLIC